MLTLDLAQCPEHGTLALIVGETRITSHKCCGWWDTVQSWPLRDVAVEEMYEQWVEDTHDD